jgi:hypothetical protein
METIRLNTIIVKRLRRKARRALPDRPPTALGEIREVTGEVSAAFDLARDVLRVLETRK